MNRRDVSALAGIALLYLLIESLGVTCPIRFLTGISCAGCGMSRAWLSLLRLDFAGALRFHPLFWLPIPAAALLLLRPRLPKRVFTVARPVWGAVPPCLSHPPGPARGNRSLCPPRGVDLAAAPRPHREAASISAAYLKCKAGRKRGFLRRDPPQVLKDATLPLRRFHYKRAVLYLEECQLARDSPARRGGISQESLCLF